MKTRFFTILLAIFAVAMLLASCDAQPRQAIGVTEGSGTPAVTETASPPENTSGAETSAAPGIFQTSELGLLVRAAENLTVKPFHLPPLETEDEEVDQLPSATAIFARETGNEYQLRVFRKDEKETLTQWNKHSHYGDVCCPPETVMTKNGYTGYIYDSNDLGAVPVQHIVIATRRFVYRFDWVNPALPQDPDELHNVLRQNPDGRYFEVPQDFIDFIKEIEVAD